MQGVRQGMDAARAQIRELVASRTAIAAAAQAADERALAAKRRLPELEANKKTAAAARVSACHSECQICAGMAAGCALPCGTQFP